MTRSSMRTRDWKAGSARKVHARSSSQPWGVGRRKEGSLVLQSETSRQRSQSGLRTRALEAQTQRRTLFATTVAAKGTSPAIATSRRAAKVDVVAEGAVAAVATAVVAAEGEAAKGAPGEAALVDARAPSAEATISSSSATSSQSLATSAAAGPTTPTPSAQTGSLGPSTRWSSGT